MHMRVQCAFDTTFRPRVSFGLALTGFAAISRWLLYVEDAPWAWVHFFFCGVMGMVTAYIFILSTQVILFTKERSPAKVI